MLHNMRKTHMTTHAKEAVALRTGRDVPDLLRELYVQEGKSQVAVAEELGVTRQTVAMWLREYGIERPEAIAS